MKTRTALAVLTCSAAFVTACGQSNSDADLPQGVQPKAVEAEDEPIELVEEDDLPHNDTPEQALLRRSVPGMSYLLPEGWSEGPDKPMRLLTLIPPAEFEGAELAIARWPTDVGGFRDNVARWSQQAGVAYEPAKRTGYPQLDIGGTQSAYIPLVNKDRGNAILAVWVPRGDNPDQPAPTWTFKLTCTAEQALKLEPALKEFVKTIQFE